MKFFNKLISKKQSPVASTMLNMPIAQVVTRDINSFIEDGYKKNVIINRCIREIVQGIAVCEVEIHKGDNVLEKHAVYDLLYHPNPTESGPQFFRHIFTDYLIGGNIFIVQSPELGAAKELWAIDPRCMEVIPGPFGVPKEYKFKQGNVEKVFPVDPITGDCQVFHYKNYNPTNPNIGLSPMQAAALVGDAHNAAVLWNYSLLKNGARPSGILKFKGSPSDDVLSKMREYFKKAFSGPANAGEVPMLLNESDFVPVSESAKDMDYISTLKEFSKYIASVYGVPLPLIDNDASTFNNVEQAKERLWTDTIIPLFDDFLDSFGYWLFGRMKLQDHKLCINLDSIQALEIVRERRFKRMGQAVKDGLISIDEARDALAYTERGGMCEEILVQSGYVPVEMIGIDTAQPIEDSPTVEPTDNAGKSLYKTLKQLNFSKEEIQAAFIDAPSEARH